jgi:hypothetical protein
LLVLHTVHNQHRNFLRQCVNIVLDFRECSIAFELSPTNCHGIHELVVNTLPSFLALAARRYPLVLDLDDKNELSLIEWIIDRIEHARIKQFSHAIKVVNQDNNVITVIINIERKKIVILPLGLNRKLLPNVRIHSVEDYFLVQIPEKLKAKHGENSKRMIEELVRDEKITEQQIQTNIEKSINDYSNLISNYLRPLWEPI